MIKKTQNHRENVYGPLLRKTFTAALASELQRQIPSLGVLTADRLARHIDGMVQDYFPPTERLRMGQMLWPAVAKDETSGYGKRIENMRLKPVMLDAITAEDIDMYLKGATQNEVRQRTAARLFDQAFAQGGVLTCADVATIMGVSAATVSKCIRLVEADQKRTVPRRATVHDIGPSVTHKRQICYQVIVLGKSIEDTARDTCHSPEAVTRYVQDYRRVYQCLKSSLSLEQTAFATKIPRSVVSQYADLQQSFSPANSAWEKVK